MLIQWWRLRSHCAGSHVPSFRRGVVDGHRVLLCRRKSWRWSCFSFCCCCGCLLWLSRCCLFPEDFLWFVLTRWWFCDSARRKKIFSLFSRPENFFLGLDKQTSSSLRASSSCFCAAELDHASSGRKKLREAFFAHPHRKAGDFVGISGDLLVVERPEQLCKSFVVGCKNS